MTTTVQDAADHPPAPGECWCCGRRGDSAQMVHLGNHSEVALCFGCARWAAKQARTIENQAKAGPLVLAGDHLQKAWRGVTGRVWHRSAANPD